MRISYDNNPNGETIEIGGKSAELLGLGRALMKAEKITILGDRTPSNFYPIVLDELAFEPLPQEDALLTITVDRQRVLLSGGVGVAKRLGQSLENVFSGSVLEGRHLHLDYFEGNGFLAPTNFSLIVQLEAV
jgi:hypothetical protein